MKSKINITEWILVSLGISFIVIFFLCLFTIPIIQSYNAFWDCSNQGYKSYEPLNNNPFNLKYKCQECSFGDNETICYDNKTAMQQGDYRITWARERG